jgi:hypothetical protein
VSIDKAEWHTDTIPSGLPEEAAGTHIGMFVAWALLNGLLAQAHQERSPDALKAVRARAMTGRAFLYSQCDGKLTERDLAAEGLAFVSQYYSKHFFKDYERALCAALPSMYHVSDTWDNYDLLAPIPRHAAREMAGTCRAPVVADLETLNHELWLIPRAASRESWRIDRSAQGLTINKS